MARLQRLLVQQIDGGLGLGQTPVQKTFPGIEFAGRTHAMIDCTIRLARPGDEPGAYHVCLKTGDYGKDGEAFYSDDPDALGRVFVGPYLAYEPD